MMRDDTLDHTGIDAYEETGAPRSKLHSAAEVRRRCGCGAVNEDDAQYCRRCGRRFAARPRGTGRRLALFILVAIVCGLIVLGIIATSAQPATDDTAPSANALEQSSNARTAKLVAGPAKG